MNEWQWFHAAMMLINGGCTIFAAICIDRAERASDGWFHGNAANWRIVAALNAAAFGANALMMAVLP